MERPADCWDGDDADTVELCRKRRGRKESQPRRSSRGPIRLRWGVSFATQLESTATQRQQFPVLSSSSASRRMDAPDQGQSAAGASIRRSLPIACARKQSGHLSPYCKNRANRPPVSKSCRRRERLSFLTDCGHSGYVLRKNFERSGNRSQVGVVGACSVRKSVENSPLSPKRRYKRALGGRPKARYRTGRREATGRRPGRASGAHSRDRKKLCAAQQHPRLTFGERLGMLWANQD